MPIRPRHQAEQDFGPFLGKIHEAVTEGHRDYPRLYASHASTHRQNTRRSVIRDHIVKRLRAALDGERGVHIANRNGTTYFHFYGRWQLIVRMLSEKHGVALNKTQLAFDIQANADGSGQGTLFPGATKLYLGYITPENSDELEVVIVAPDGKRNAWNIEVQTPDSGAVVMLVPKAPAPEDETLVRIPQKKTGQETNE